MKKKRSWLQRYWDNLYTTEDVQHLSTLPSDIDDDKLWQESLDSALDSDDKEKEQHKAEARQLLDHLRKSKVNPKNKHRQLQKLLSVAALVCFVFGSIYLWNYWRKTSVLYLEIATSVNERQDIVLPDGTRLTLNACSRVRYPEQFTNETRNVELEGEGFFKVAHDETHPFIVKTSRMEVQVLGTQFNMKSYSTDEIISVEVEEGKVQVSLPEIITRLKAGDQLVYNTSSNLFTKQHIKHDIACWRNGYLYFDKTPITDVAKMLERLYGCHIRFAPHQEFNNLVSGEHDNQSLESVLQSIEYTSGIHYVKEKKGFLLYKDQEPT